MFFCYKLRVMLFYPYAICLCGGFSSYNMLGFGTLKKTRKMKFCFHSLREYTRKIKKNVVILCLALWFLSHFFSSHHKKWPLTLNREALKFIVWWNPMRSIKVAKCILYDENKCSPHADNIISTLILYIIHNISHGLNLMMQWPASA